MPVRKRLNHDTKTREKIQTTQIVKRLTSHIFGEIEMTATQVTAGLGLLKKTLPDLQSVEMDVTGQIDIDSLSTEALINQANELIRKNGMIDDRLN